ncbi:hypothetical protein M434DRAFT_393778 [Hypoxylon sp. CO27-5]|nr:hypothetical protein M434DRAFT_393778 [Hypoxylon sp. CO27-5]
MPLSHPGTDIPVSKSFEKEVLDRKSTYPALGERTQSGIDLWDDPQPPESDIIEQFLQQYASHDDQKEWNKLKSQAMDICKQRLEEKSLLAYVTGRVKEEKSLRKRLYQYPPTEGRDILSYRWDFVGLRIALFFPGQILKVEDIIREAFEEQPKYRKPKGTWPTTQAEGSAAQSYLKRFGGYDEAHYWVKLRMEDRTSAGAHSEQLFEIQLRSVIMDPWITIVHDLEYKAMAGELSIEEHRILDSIKGLASTGEVLLEHLEQIHLSRLASDENDIKDVDELGRLLYTYLPELQTTPITQNGRCNVFYPLFTVLKATEITTIGALRVTLGKLDMRKKLVDECQKWIQSVQHLFRATSLDFILYTILRHIPDQNISPIWEKIVFLKLTDLLAESQGKKPLLDSDISEEESINELVGHLVWNALWEIVSRMLSQQQIQLESRLEDHTDDGKARRGHHSTHIFNKSDTERFAALWYGSLCALRPSADASYALTLLKASLGRDISSLEFALQRYLLSSTHRALVTRQMRVDPNWIPWLNDNVENNDDAWNLGFERFSRIVQDVSSQSVPKQETMHAEPNIMEACWSSLEFAASEAVPSILRLEIKRYEKVCAMKKSELDWRKVLRLSVGSVGGRHRPWIGGFVSDTCRIEVVTTVLKQVEMADDDDSVIETRFSEFCRQNWNELITVLIEGQRKWRKEPLVGDLDEIIAKYGAAPKPYVRQTWHL